MELNDQRRYVLLHCRFIYYLCLHPDVQGRVADEIETVLEGGELTEEHIKRLQ